MSRGARLLRAGFWISFALALASPARSLFEYVTAPTLLLSLQDATSTSDARRPPFQSVVSISREARAAIHSTPPSRIEWAVRLRPGRHRLETAVGVDPQAWGRSGTIVLQIVLSGRGDARQLASETIDLRHRPDDLPWHPVRAEFETDAEAMTLALITDTGSNASATIDGVYWEAPRLVSLTDPPSVPLILCGVAALAACWLAARRRAVSIGFFGRRLVWVVYTIAIGVLLTEGVLRVAGWQPLPSPLRSAVAGAESAAWMDATVEDPELGYRYRANLSTTWPWEEGEHRTRVHFTTDSDGFRNPPALPQPRVVLLGDSFVEGDLVDEPDTLRAQLARETGWTVRNLALSGYGPQQYAIAARRFGLPARPEIVVLGLFEGNDLGDAEFFDEWRQSTATWNDYVFAALRARQGSVLVRANMHARTLDALARITTGLRTLLRPPAGVVPPANLFDPLCDGDPAGPKCMSFSGGLLYRETIPPAELSATKGWELTRVALREVRDACQLAGAHLLVVIIPSKESLFARRIAGAVSPGAFDRFVADASGMDGPPHYDRFVANHGALDQILEPFLREEGIDFLNLRSLFERAASEGRGPYLRFDMHWNANGHQQVARAIAGGLRGR